MCRIGLNSQCSLALQSTGLTKIPEFVSLRSIGGECCCNIELIRIVRTCIRLPSTDRSLPRVAGALTVQSNALLTNVTAFSELRSCGGQIDINVSVPCSVLLSSAITTTTTRSPKR